MSSGEKVLVELTRAGIETTVAELDAMGHSKAEQREHPGPVDERCPACDVLDALRAALTKGDTDRP